MRTSLPLFLASLLLAGCGGGGGSSHPSPGGGTTVPEAKGTATVSVAWPARGKFVPLSSNSVVVALSMNGASVAQQTLARPSDGSTNSTATFTGLAYGKYAVALAAYPKANGTGTAQATGAASMTVTEDVPGSTGVSLATTVASIAILPVAFDKNATAAVSVGATDAQGNTVLLAVGTASEAVAWSIDPVVNSLGATVPAATLSSTTGATITLTGVHSGTTQIHASVSLGLPAPLTATGTVTVNAIADGSGTVTVS